MHEIPMNPETSPRSAFSRFESKVERAKSFERDLTFHADARSEDHKASLAKAMREFEFRRSISRPMRMTFVSANEANPQPGDPHYAFRIHISKSPAEHETNFGGGWIRRLPESFIVIPPNLPSQVRGNCRNQFDSLLLEFPESELQQIAGEFLETDGAHLRRPPGKELHNPFVSQLAKQLWSQMGGTSIGEEIMIEGSFLSLIGRLLTLGDHKLPAYPQSERGSAEIVQRALAFMRDNLGEKVSLSQIAATARVSRPYLTRIFRKATGRTVHDHLTELRIQRAKELMLYFGKNLTLAEIATQCGFFDGGHMSRVFLEQLGVTPGQYRDQI